MAEVLAVVASGAGLASLGLQIASFARTLRHGVENAARLRNDAAILSEDLEILSAQLLDLELGVPDILQEQKGPILLDGCRSRAADVLDRLREFTAAITDTGSKRAVLRQYLSSNKGGARLGDLQRAVAALKQDVIMLYLIHQNIAMKKLLPASLPSTEDTPGARAPPTEPSATDSDPPVGGVSSSLPITRHFRAPDCAVRQCSCSCHELSSSAGKYWRFQYSPLAGLFKTCNNARCTARRYRLSVRLALTSLRLPWATVLGLELISEPGRFWLQPALRVETVVKNTAPGFVILWKLSESILKWEEAKSQLESLYRNDPSFARQVDSHGRGYIEKAVSYGWYSAEGIAFGELEQLLRLLVFEFHARPVPDTSALILDCASHADEDNHTTMLDILVSIGCDFSAMAQPTLESWPKPCVFGQEISPYGGNIHIPEDPFYIDFLADTLRISPDFGDSPELHYVALHRSDEDLMRLAQRSPSLGTQVNFLGQTPLHISVRRYSSLVTLLEAGHPVNISDANGYTPLMYAAAMNLPESTGILIEHGADLFQQGNEKNYNFLMFAAARNHWDLVWDAVDKIESKDRSLLPRAFSGILQFTGVGCYFAHCPERKSLAKGMKVFWIKTLTKLGDLNVCFENGNTLVNFVNHPHLAKVLAETLIFNSFNRRNDLGEHSLFAITRFFDPSLFRLYVEKGADINTRNNRGQTVLHKLVDSLLTSNADRHLSSLLEILAFMLDTGAGLTVTDNCSCDCSPGGCLPGSGAKLCMESLLGMTVSNGFWIFEWLAFLEERGLVSEAKEFALSILRQTLFDEAGLHHKCCKHGVEDDNSERFWDISARISLDKLDESLCVWDKKSYDEVKIGLMSLLSQKRESVDRASSTAPKQTGRGIADQSNEGPPDYRIDYQEDEMYSGFDMFLLHGKDDIDFDIAPLKYEDFFKAFVDSLRRAKKREEFHRRLPMLEQISEFFGFSIPEKLTLGD